MMVSNWLNIQRGDWCIRIYREGGYSVSYRIKIGDSVMWINADDDCSGISDEMLEDAKTIYRAMHGKDMVW